MTPGRVPIPLSARSRVNLARFHSTPRGRVEGWIPLKHISTRALRALAVSAVTLVGLAVAVPASATNDDYQNHTLTKNVSSASYYYDSNIKACVRYNMTGKLTVPVNRDTINSVYARSTLSNIKMYVAFTSNCSSWTYVKRNDVALTTSMWSNSCGASIDLGLSVPWSAGVGFSISCSAGKKTALGYRLISNLDDSFYFDFTNEPIKFGAEVLTTTGKPTLTYCNYVDLRITYSNGSKSYGGPTRELRPCASWDNPYY